jgi:hypothetical protein
MCNRFSSIHLLFHEAIATRFHFPICQTYQVVPQPTDNQLIQQEHETDAAA